MSKYDKYSIPKVCIYCGSEVNLVSNSEIHGREYGNGKVYKCTNCDSYVGVYPDLKTPLGILANKELCNLKKKAHFLFDSIWKTNKISRTQAYSMLASRLGISTKECHFGWFDKPMLEKAIRILEEGLLNS